MQKLEVKMIQKCVTHHNKTKAIMLARPSCEINMKRNSISLIVLHNDLGFLSVSQIIIYIFKEI